MTKNERQAAMAENFKRVYCKPEKPKKDFLKTYKMEHMRAEQLALNCRWLVDQIDKIHWSLVHGETTGTWQNRAEQAVAAAATVTICGSDNMNGIGTCKERATVHLCKKCYDKHLGLFQGAVPIKIDLKMDKAIDAHFNKRPKKIRKILSNDHPRV